MLAKVRERAREEQQQRHEEIRRQKILEEEQKQRHREQCITEVAQKLQLKKRQKKEEEQRLKLELKEIATKRQFLAASAEQVEAKAHAEQQAGLDREAMKRQKVTLIEQRKKNQTKEHEIEEYQQMQQTVTARVERAKAADLVLKQEILQSVQSARNMQRHTAKKNEFIRVLGKGAFGVVELWRQKFKDEQLGAQLERLVAAKRDLPLHGSQMDCYISCVLPGQEAQVLKALEHPHIVTYMGSWVNRKEEDLIIVQHYCDGGDLAHYIFYKKKNKELIPETNVIQWLAQLSHALQYCHKRAKILHRDVKPSNVFLTQDLRSVQLGDFGIAKNLRSTATLCQTVVGTQAYMSPELTRMQKYGPKTEVWSLGATLYEMCAQEKLYVSADVLELVEQIASTKEAPRLSSELGYSWELQEICAAMLVKDPGTRPTLSEMLTDHELLRVTVLQLERNVEWKDSLVPEELHSLEVPSESQEKLRELFKKYSKNGLLSRTELTNLLQKLHPKWASGVASVLLKAADSNGDENLDYEEFLSWLLGGEQEWTPIKQAMISAEDDADAPVLPEGSGGGFSEMAADARERLLKSSTGSGMTLEEAAEVKELQELVKLQKDLIELLKQFPAFDPISEAMAVLDFSSWSVPQLKEYISAEGRSIAGLSEKQDLVELCDQIFADSTVSSDPVSVSPEERRLGAESLARAKCIDARLRCIQILQDTSQAGPDPVELAVAVRQAQRLLSTEPCETAILSHSQRLGMCAEDQFKSAKTLPEMEQAVNLMQAVQDAVKMPDGRKNCVSARALDEANSCLQQTRMKEKQIGVRSQCGPFVKNISLKGDVPFPELQKKLAELWSKPLDSLSFFTTDGQLLDAEKWQELQLGKGPIEAPDGE
ncbi:unnamed protein product [Durusdinium trenchii]|uniref:non-specific serine/threonine protein kinase n=1 Tax=Durusdinium trenchii TaxID=1381693 RepID=A0ABP0NKR2_9DINO